MSKTSATATRPLAATARTTRPERLSDRYQSRTPTNDGTLSLALGGVAGRFDGAHGATPSLVCPQHPPARIGRGVGQLPDLLRRTTRLHAPRGRTERLPISVARTRAHAARCRKIPPPPRCGDRGGPDRVPAATAKSRLARDLCYPSVASTRLSGSSKRLGPSRHPVPAFGCWPLPPRRCCLPAMRVRAGGGAGAHGGRDC